MTSRVVKERACAYLLCEPLESFIRFLGRVIGLVMVVTPLGRMSIRVLTIIRLIRLVFSFPLCCWLTRVISVIRVIAGRIAAAMRVNRVTRVVGVVGVNRLLRVRVGHGRAAAARVARVARVAISDGRAAAGGVGQVRVMRDGRVNREVRVDGMIAVGLVL